MRLIHKCVPYQFSTFVCAILCQCNNLNILNKELNFLFHSVKQREGDFIIEVRQSNNHLPICAANFPKEQGNSICQALGKDHVLIHSEAKLETAQSLYLTWDPSSSSDGELLQNLVVVTSCPDNEVVAIECNTLSCGTRDASVVQDYIVGGTDAGEGRWPWQVGILLNDALTCGGSVISRHHILTAAHCTGWVN